MVSALLFALDPVGRPESQGERKVPGPACQDAGHSPALNVGHAGRLGNRRGRRQTQWKIVQERGRAILTVDLARYTLRARPEDRGGIPSEIAEARKV